MSAGSRSVRPLGSSDGTSAPGFPLTVSVAWTPASVGVTENVTEVSDSRLLVAAASCVASAPGAPPASAASEISRAIPCVLT